MTNKKMLFGLISTFVVLLIAFGVVLGYRHYVNSQVEKGNKEVTVKIIVDGEVKNEYKFRTDAEFLGPALDEKKIVEKATTYPGFGRFVDQIGGLGANENYFWYLTVNNEEAQLGIDDIAIKDQDVIVFTYTAITDYNG